MPPLSDWQKRLIYRSWHRGTREMDLIMGSFADRHVPAFSDAELASYEEILNNNDPDLYDWVTGRVEPPDNPLIVRLQAHKIVQSAG